MARWAEVMRALQSTVALVTIALVVARPVARKFKAAER